MRDLAPIILALPAIIFIGVCVGLILAWPFQVIWNECVCFAVDFAQPVTFWQAFGLMVLLHSLKPDGAKQ